MINQSFLLIARLVASFCTIFLCDLPIFAQQQASNIPAAISSGSERLTLFALQLERSFETDRLGEVLQYGQAMRIPKSRFPLILSSRARLVPILSYQNNLNGGIVGRSFEFGGLTFEVAENDRAKSGMLFGLDASVNARIGLSLGNVLTLAAAAQQSHSPSYNLNITKFLSQACDAQFLGGASWFDFCYGNSISLRKKNLLKTQNLSFGGSRLFSSSLGLHEASATITNTWVIDLDRSTNSSDTYRQASLILKLVSAQENLGVLVLDLSVDERVKGRNVREFGMGLSLTRPVLGESTEAFATFSHEGGGTFFGTLRHDDIYSIGFKREFRKIVRASIKASYRRSNIDFYNAETSIDIDLNFINYRF